MYEQVVYELVLNLTFKISGFAAQKHVLLANHP